MADFVSKHPGGSEWLEITKGIDITEQFETHHITGKAEQILKKYFVRDAAQPRNYRFTYKENGFYKTLKRRVAEKIDKIDRSPEKISNLISDLMLGLVLTSVYIIAKSESKIMAVIAGLLINFQFIISHNFFHKKDNWRMYCANFSLFTYNEWRISHALSHHLYPNSYYDLEITMYEPILCWLPFPKSWLRKMIMTLISPIVWSLVFPSVAIQRLGGYLTREERFRPDHLIPLLIPSMIYFFGEMDVLTALKLWGLIVLSSSLIFQFIALHAGHQHPGALHEGDEIE